MDGDRLPKSTTWRPALRALYTDVVYGLDFAIRLSSSFVCVMCTPRSLPQDFQAQKGEPLAQSRRLLNADVTIFPLGIPHHAS
jgi:hypothetical protein